MRRVNPPRVVPVETPWPWLAPICRHPHRTLPTVMSQPFEWIRERPSARLAVLWNRRLHGVWGGGPAAHPRPESWDHARSGDDVGHAGASVAGRGRRGRAGHVRPVG